MILVFYHHSLQLELVIILFNFIDILNVTLY